MDLEEGNVLVGFAGSVAAGDVLDQTVSGLKGPDGVFQRGDLEGVPLRQQPLEAGYRVPSVEQPEHFRREQFVRLLREVQSQCLSKNY